MLQENTKNIWTQKVKNTDLYGRIQLKENILQKIRTVWAHMQNAQQQEDKGADV